MKKLVGVLLPFLLAAPAAAIPNYGRFYKTKYGYLPHCSACHQLQNWEMTDFGKAFRDQGRGLAGLAALEGKDSDGDGAKNGDEAQAKSNPGDPYSAPARPGPWLAEAKILPPAKALKKVFPGYKDADVLTPEWTPQTLQALPAADVNDEVRYPVLFRVKDSQGAALGTAAYSTYDTPGPHAGANVLLISANTQEEIVGIEVVHHHGDAALKKPAYLDLFLGKALDGLKSPPQAPVGTEKEAQAFVGAVRRALLAMGTR